MRSGSDGYKRGRRSALGRVVQRDTEGVGEVVQMDTRWVGGAVKMDTRGVGEML